MFVILTILNIPVLLIYPSPTKYNPYSDPGVVFGLFTLGNMARPNPACGYSDLKRDMDPNETKRSPEIILKCPEGERISELTYFGLLYLEDKQTGSRSNAAAQCAHIEDPRVSKEEFT